MKSTGLVFSATFCPTAFPGQQPRRRLPTTAVVVATTPHRIPPHSTTTTNNINNNKEVGWICACYVFSIYTLVRPPSKPLVCFEYSKLKGPLSRIGLFQKCLFYPYITLKKPFLIFKIEKKTLKKSLKI